MLGSAFWREAGEALGAMATFVAFGLAWAELEARAVRPAAPYPLLVAEGCAGSAREAEGPSIWLVDGFNVLHAGVLRGRNRADWWKEPRRAELVRLASQFAGGAEIWIVFDGPHSQGSNQEAADDAPRVRQIFAPSADQWLLGRVKNAGDPSRLAVVTADRRVAERARRRGARIVSPRAFLERCELG